MPIENPNEGTELIITPETAPAGPQPRPDIQESLPYNPKALQAAEAAEAKTVITQFTEISAEEIKKLQEEADKTAKIQPSNTYGEQKLSQ